MKARERRIVEKLSVIIPVYNTKDDLRKCLDSIINQTVRIFYFSIPEIFAER